MQKPGLLWPLVLLPSCAANEETGATMSFSSRTRSSRKKNSQHLHTKKTLSPWGVPKMKASQSSEILESTLRTAPEGHHWCATEAPGSSFWSHLIIEAAEAPEAPAMLSQEHSELPFPPLPWFAAWSPWSLGLPSLQVGISPRHAPKSAHPINTTSACTAWVPNSKLENPIESCIQDLGRNEWKVDSKLQEKALGYNSYSS